MIIGLLGFEFESSNKGCEALSYAVMPILNSITEDLQIVVFNIHDSLGKIPDKFPDIKFKNVKIKIKSKNFWKEFKILLNECNIILDITHGDSFSDIYGKKWLIQTNLLKSFVLLNNKPLVLMPQTYGPFNNWFFKQWSKIIINKAYKVYSRDKKSTHYITDELKCKNITPFTTYDLAFSLPYDNLYNKKNKIKIRINISGLLWNYKKMKNNNISLNVDYIKYHELLIEWLIRNDKYEIYLVPHVLCTEREGEDYYDNDCKVLKEIQNKYKKCIYRDNFETVIDVKSYISSLDILIASRMHASIGAFSSGVCSIPFAYSRKFAGVYDDLNYKYLIDGQSLSTEEAFDITIGYINKFEEIRKYSNKCMEDIRYNSLHYIKDFKTVLEDFK